MQPGDDSSQAHTRYGSKVDAITAVPLAAGPIIPLVVVVLTVILAKAPLFLIALVILIDVVTVAFVRRLIFPLYYDIMPSALLVRCGRRSWNIALDTIQQVFPTRNPISSPAMSLDRLQVDYSQDGQARSLIISPKDKTAFLGELASRNGVLKVRDGRIVRRA